MNKAPEEGNIWEWRAFGKISPELAAQVKSFPTRMSVVAYQGEDIYLISTASDHNVKLRKWGDRWLLKLKLLLATEPGAIDLYNESSEMVYRFPINAEGLQQTAALLGVKLPEIARSKESFSEDEMLEALASSTPPVARVVVTKVRTQFQFEGGWLELADVVFPHHALQSVSVHSYEIKVVEEILTRLRPGPELEAMNYIEACRRWM
jgi:hypothetical protein